MSDDVQKRLQALERAQLGTQQELRRLHGKAGALVCAMQTFRRVLSDEYRQAFDLVLEQSIAELLALAVDQPWLDAFEETLTLVRR